MTSKEVVQTMYDCFTTGDMEKFASMYHEDAIIKVNGMHSFSGTHEGIAAWMSVLSTIPAMFDNFSVTQTNMIAEGNQVFTQLHAKADGMDANFGHYHKIEDGKIKEFWIYDDSQKMAHTMKAV